MKSRIFSAVLVLFMAITIIGVGGMSTVWAAKQGEPIIVGAPVPRADRGQAAGRDVGGRQVDRVLAGGR